MFVVPKHFAGTKRFERILGVLAKHGLGIALERMHFKKRTLFSMKKNSNPVQVRMILEELGGSFIKLGQLLSMRPDLIPKEYCDELSKLLDSIEPFPYEEVESIIKFEFKKPIKSLFKSFEKKPIAAASIGQVHIARLKDGKKVAVKIMRPGVKALFEHDLEIMDYLARHIKHYLNPEIFDPEEIFAEFKRYTEDELDYLKEAHNIRVFCNNYSSDKKIRLPCVYEKYTTSKVLTMSFLEGAELLKIINNPKDYKVNRKSLSNALADCFMKQVFIGGVFHADPHPGNIVVDKGGLGLLDFGVIGRLDNEMKEKLGMLFISLIESDVSGLTRSLISLNLMSSDVDVNGLKQELSSKLGEYYDVGLDKIDFTELFLTAISIARKYKIKISRDYVLLGKAMITLKTVCYSLDPKFNLVYQAKPFITKLLKQKTSPSYLLKRLGSEAGKISEFVQELPDTVRKASAMMNKADIALDDINKDLHSLTTEMRREGGRLVFGIVIAALVISASLIYPTSNTAGEFFVALAGILFVYVLFSILRDFFFRKR